MTRRVAGNQTLRERRRSVSQQAPLQNRFGETVRRRWTGIQLRDRRVMLLARENDFTNNVIFQRVERLVVADELLGQRGRSRERFATIGGVAVVRALLIGRRFGRTPAMFVAFGLGIERRRQAGDDAMVGREK